MNNLDQVNALRDRLVAEGTPKPDTIRQIAFACIGWPYVFGAWGEECTPNNRKRRARDDHPTIKSKCQVLSGKTSTCNGCQWYPADCRVRMYDCRGWTRWLLQQVGLDITGEGATSQYNTVANWVRKGKISELPDCVCCVFKYNSSTGKMEHTGMYLTGGVVVDCSVNVRSVGMSGWTHYAIPVGLYSEEEIPVTTVKPTLRKGDSGDSVRALQERLNELGYNCGDVDGKFGKKTDEAVRKFQKDHGLTADGIVGKATWAALDSAEKPKETTYTVRCYGMTWDQVMQLRAICPTAEVAKEGD